MGKTIRRKDKKQKKFLKNKNRNKDNKRTAAYHEEDHKSNDRDFNHY